MMLTGLGRKQNALIAMLLSVVVLVGALLLCDTAHDWGDDFAAYILEGRAIATGTTQQLFQDNLFLHPSEILFGDVSEMSEVIYVWGYPAVLSLVYKLTGFQFDIPQHILYYKIPNYIALAALAAILYLFYLRRLSPSVSAALTLFALYLIPYESSIIGTDPFFLCFSFLCFYLYEQFRETGTQTKKILLGTLLGCSLWYTYEIRLNGNTVVVLLALQTLLCLWKTKPGRKELLLELHPFALYLVLFLTGRLLLPVPTSNMGDVGLGSLTEGLLYCRNTLVEWLYDITPFGTYRFRWLVMHGLELLFYIGLISQGWRREWWYTLFFGATILVNASLPYTQGIRYFYNILPFVLLYIAFGVETVYTLVCRCIAKENHRCLFSRCFVALIAAFVTVELAAQGFAIQSHRVDTADAMSRAAENAYAEGCIEAYRFILDETEESAIFAFRKPRALYLNTNRMSFAPGINGHSLESADYYMRLIAPRWEEPLTDAEWEMLQLVFSNDEIEIYKVKKDT